MYGFFKGSLGVSQGTQKILDVAHHPFHVAVRGIGRVDRRLGHRTIYLRYFLKGSINNAGSNPGNFRFLS
jgi:hypothetical protein